MILHGHQAATSLGPGFSELWKRCNRGCSLMSPIERPSDSSLDYHRLKSELNGSVICINGADKFNNNNELSNKLKRQTSTSSSCSSSGGGGADTGNNYYNNNKICEQQIEDIPKCNRNRQLFGIQLEVTSLLLEAERRKLTVLQRELQVALEDSGSIKKAKEQLKQELILAISRIQLQYDLLEKEYKQHAIGRLRSSNTRGIGKSNRSQPAIGLKQTPKARPTIFGTVASDQCPKDNVNRRGLPQTTSKSVDKQLLSSQSLSVESQKDILDTDENALVYRDGNLISGPLDALIQHMVPTSNYYPDRSYLFAFLLSARLFIRPHELLAKICQLCEEQQNFPNHGPINKSNNLDGISSDQHDGTSPQQPEAVDGPSDAEGYKRLRTFAHNFVQLLAEWIDTFPYDFRDERLMQHVKAMTQKCISIDTSLRKDASTMLQNLVHRLTVLEKYEEFLQSLARGSNDCRDMSGLIGNAGGKGGGNVSAGIVAISNTEKDSSSQQGHQQQGHITATSQTGSNISSSSLISNASATSMDISELCPNPTLLAHQLTHIELERLSHIGPEEFVQAFAKENPHLEQSFSDMKKTRNLESYVQWFNRLSYLVATEIVKHPKKKQRVRIVEYWIETARESFNIGNFNSLMAIIAGLNMSPISRLKKTWAKVQSAKFAVLEHQMDPSSNFNSYRSTLKAAMWRSAGATDERERIVIPFFSLLVKDLYFLNEGCSNKLPNGHINFEKFWQLAKQVTEFIAWKQVTCPFEKLPKVIMFLQTNHVLNENTLAMASFECEPPENHEKDRYKCLKSEQQQQQHHHHQQQLHNHQNSNQQ